MAKALSIKEVLQVSSEILAENGNDMHYEDWKKAMLERDGIDTRTVSSLIMNKRVKLVLLGAVVGEKPDLRVQGGVN